MLKAFTKHPATVGETYFKHLAHAGGFGSRMVLGGLACIVHAIFPFLFIKTGSRLIADLHRRMIEQRTRTEDGWSYVI
ncbi:DUF6356 family protein [Aurantiacibacter aquimixticola]|uniref:Capsule biosynthesis protein n=1 Tax=Aurantiacibacter aquimixticola TaxID=1958945 RepID=A0A419RW86_9SPHN|nr:DUF6356 family protein [Aurantiacibacter aquimixticola]RJY10027.1 hypothetical protein D6201_12285 [Aurantiacibacter aquimixticola]